MTREDAQALDAVRNVKKALLDEILARFPFGKPEPVDAKKVEKFVEVLLKWLMLDDAELGFLLEVRVPGTLKLRVTVKPDNAEPVEGDYALGLKQLLAAWMKGRDE